MSKFLTINLRDFLKGLVVAILSAVLMFLQSVLVDPTIVNWKQVAIKCLWTAAAAIVAYLLKNLVTNNNDEILKPDKK